MSDYTANKSTKLKTNLLTILMFGGPMGVFFAIPAIVQTGDVVFGIIWGLLIGILAGLLFTALLNVFAKWQARKFRKTRDEIAEKFVVLYDDAANHLVGREGVGGWLFLTSSGLFFKSHKLNFQAHELWIPFETIQSVSTYKSLGFIENGLLLERVDGTQNKFVVYNPKLWIEKIEPQRRPQCPTTEN